MKNIKEFITEGVKLSNTPITKSTKSIAYPSGKRTHVCIGVVLGQKEYDKLLNELGEPEENINNFVKFAWTCQLYKTRFILFSSIDRKVLENYLKRDGFISLDIWASSLSMDQRLIACEAVVKYFGELSNYKTY